MYNFTNDVIGFCKDLFEHTPIKYFNYARYCRNGDICSVSTNPQWYKYYISDSKFVDIATKQVFSENRVILWSTSFPEILATAKQEFGLEQPIVITRKDNFFYTEVYCFASDCDHVHQEGIDKLTEYYFNNISLLRGFASEFSSNLRLMHKAMDEISYAKSKLTPFLDGNRLLTKRELDCYFCLLKGQSAREIGNSLCISVRTVETYLISLKRKLNCQSRSQLFTKAIEMGLLNLNVYSKKQNVAYYDNKVKNTDE